MGRMFEQQVRIAQALGAAAIATNPLLASAARSAPPAPEPAARVPAKTGAAAATTPTARSLAQIGEAAMKRDRSPAQPPRATKTFPRTHSLLV